MTDVKRRGLQRRRLLKVLVASAAASGGGIAQVLAQAWPLP